jgi:hypothetical protein
MSSPKERTSRLVKTDFRAIFTFFSLSKPREREEAMKKPVFQFKLNFLSLSSLNTNFVLLLYGFVAWRV